MTLQQIAARFEERGFRVKWQPDGGVRCQCSGHGGKDLNLVMHRGDRGGIVVSCKVHDCPLSDVAAGVGLEVTDFMPAEERPNGGHGLPYPEPVARYRYTEEFEVWRFEPGLAGEKKSFRPHHLDASGQWKAGNPPSGKKPLYRLADLAAADPKEPVFIAAGEKDADNLARLGLVATTNPGGEALKWGQRPEWVEPLIGRRCIILEDCDLPDPKRGVRAGEEHAKEVFAALTRANIEAKRLLLPGLSEGEDVSDWLRRGGTAEELRKLAAPEPPRLFTRFLTFAQLLEQPEPDWRVEGICFAETLFELFGPPNQGKTFVMTDFCLAVRQGGYWCGRKITVPGPVVYVNADGGKGFARRARAWVEINGRVEAPHEFWTYPTSINLYREQDMIEFRAALAYMDEAPAVVVFDTYSRCIPGVNENQQEEASLVVEHLDQMKLQFGCTVGLLHHTGKDGIKDRGSSVILGAMDTAARVDQKDDVVIVTCEKQRDAAFFDPLYFDLGRIAGTNAVWITARDQAPAITPTDHKEEELRLFVDLVSTEPGVTRERASLLLDINERTCERYAKTLVMRGLIVEAELPRQPGQAGRLARGLFVRTEAA